MARTALLGLMGVRGYREEHIQGVRGTRTGLAPACHQASSAVSKRSSLPGRWFKIAKIQIGGAGGDPSNNFIRSLRKSQRKDYLIGMCSVPSDLFLADTEESTWFQMQRTPDILKQPFGSYEGPGRTFCICNTILRCGRSPISKIRYKLGVKLFIRTGYHRKLHR